MTGRELSINKVQLKSCKFSESIRNTVDERFAVKILIFNEFVIAKQVLKQVTDDLKALI